MRDSNAANFCLIECVMCCFAKRITKPAQVSVLNLLTNATFT